MSIYASEAGWWAARPMHVLILGGVFERFPTLHYCLAENGAWWVPDLRERMDAKWVGDHNTRKFGTEVFRGGLTMKPGDYIDRNCWLGASTMHQTEIDRRYGIGIDNLMWGNDFPHPEGTWPHTREWLRMRFHDVPVDETRKILGLNAVDCYGFDPVALAPLVERIGPTVDDIHGGELEDTVEDGLMPSTITDFTDKVAVVTGGASGIGKGICEELAKDGASVVIADVEKHAIDKAVEELSPLGDVSGIQTDVSKADSVEALAEAVYDKYGVCHLLFNNAAIGAPGANVWDTTPNDWTWTFTVNVFGVAYGIQSFVPRMLAGGEPGYIINTSSGDGAIGPMPMASIYAASK